MAVESSTNARVALQTLREIAQTLAKQRGFDACSVVAIPDAGAKFSLLEYFPQWIAEGRAGEMEYLARRDDKGHLLREDVRHPLPWAKSVIVLAANYRADTPGSLEPHEPGQAWVARYAATGSADGRGSDYHDVLLAKLRAMEDDLHQRLQPQVSEFHSRSFVDTGPFVERTLAVEAGLGWQAKNTCLINPELGSWLFLATIVTSLELDAAAEAIALQPDRCGSCTRCIEACPTRALDQPYRMDASVCIAYLTIEKRGAIAEHLRAPIGRQIFGCDICQDVCPWNDRAARNGRFTVDPELQPRAAMINPSLAELAAMDEEQFRGWFRRTPMRRAKRAGLLRNIAIAMGNAGLPEYRARLRAWSEQSEDATLAEAAAWALEKIDAA